MKRRDVVRAITAVGLLAAVSLGTTTTAGAGQIGQAAKETQAERSACADWRQDGAFLTTIAVCGRFVDQNDRIARPTPYAEVTVRRWDCPLGGSRYCGNPQEKTGEVALDAVNIDFDAGTATVQATVDGCAVDVSWIAGTAVEESRNEDYTRAVDYQKNQVQLNKKGTYVTRNKRASATGSVCGYPEVSGPSATAYIERVHYEETYTYVDPKF